MKQTMMAKKYWSMLLAGTVYMSIATALVMSGSVIAGVMVGQDAVSGINLVTPLFCAATFLGSLFFYWSSHSVFKGNGRVQQTKG